MASFNYMNNTAPFWDFLASLEQQGNSHPLTGQNRNDESERGEDHERQYPPPFDPWGWSHQFFGGGRGMPHRGPPPPDSHGPPHHDEHIPPRKHEGEKDGEKRDKDNHEGPSGSDSDREGRPHGRGRHGRCGSHRGHFGPGGRGGFGPHHGGPGHHGPRGYHGPPHYGGPGRRGPWSRDGPFGGPCSGFGGLGGTNVDPSALAAQLFEAFAAEHPSNRSNKKTSAVANDNEDFTPEADIFDTPSSYIIHISLPGAKKEDVGVNWDAEKSELSVAGVIYRPGDEELLKTLAMNERKVGPFERKIRLGTRANPAHVDAEGITAKLEDGVLRIEVRKEDEGFVEIKKVDIE